MKTRTEAKHIFEAMGKNVMTPYPVEYGWIDDTHPYEIAEGEGMDHELIIGVSIVNTENDNRRDDRGELFNAGSPKTRLVQAREYVEELRDDNR